MKLIYKNNSYFCDNCRMRQKQLKAYCCFCGEIFSNYEEICLKLIEDENNYIIMGDEDVQEEG